MVILLDSGVDKPYNSRKFNLKINMLSSAMTKLSYGGLITALGLLLIWSNPCTAGEWIFSDGMPMLIAQAGAPVTPGTLPVETAEDEPTGSPIKTEGEKYVGLNFDFADINVVIQTIAELIDLNYILSPGISGKVTIQTSGKIAVTDLFFVLEKILEVNNLTAVKSGNFYKIIPIGSVNKEAIETIGPDEELPGEQIIIKIFKLSQSLPSDITRIFGSLKSPQGIFIPHDPTGILLVRDTASRIKMFNDLIESLDVNIYENVQVELHHVRNAQAEDLAKDLTQVLTTIATVPGRQAARFKLIPVKSINALLFVTSQPNLGDLLKNWIKELDQPATAEAEKVFVYNLNHASAENIASILRELYSEKGGTAATESTAAAAQPTTAAAAAARRRAAARTEAAAAAESAESIVSGKVKIVADTDTNSLIIQTAPWNYPSILETVRKLDKTPEQVLIEVTIAEITLDDTDELGLEWALKSQGTASLGGENVSYQSTAQSVYNTTGSPAPAVPGFSYLVSEANRLTAILNAYAQSSKLNIISRPHIIAMDNKEAVIDIGAEVPLITTQTRSDEGTNVDQTIEYRSTGIILTVKPSINSNRDVTLDVTQEISEAQTNKLGGTDSPIIIKRRAQTSMVVRDNETLIIGGIIQEKKERTREGIPLLSRIPILGYLFGATTDTSYKTELVVMMTPKVITNMEEAARVTDEFRDKTIILKKGLESR